MLPLPVQVFDMQLEDVVIPLGEEQDGLRLVENARSAEHGGIRFLQAMVPLRNGLCRAFCPCVPPNLATGGRVVVHNPSRGA